MMITSTLINYTKFWKGSPGATKYNVQISQLPFFIHLTINEYITDTFFSLPPLTEGSKYYFRIRPLSPISLCEDFGPSIPFVATQITNVRFIEGTNNFGVDFQNLIYNNQTLQLNFSGDLPMELSFKLLNSSGQIVSQEKGKFYPGQSHQINVDRLSPGMFFLIFESKQGEQYTRKIIIQ